LGRGQGQAVVDASISFYLMRCIRTLYSFRNAWPKTAGHHVSNILGKLRASNRRQAAAIAVRAALV